jgi:hypothetical protein
MSLGNGVNERGDDGDIELMLFKLKLLVIDGITGVLVTINELFSMWGSGPGVLVSGAVSLPRRQGWGMATDPAFWRSLLDWCCT